jgi:drug/metabolite transporter (DMT)-like permease
MNTFLIALASIAVSVAAQFSLKAGMSSDHVQTALLAPHSFRTALTVLTYKYIVVGFLLYGVGAIIWLRVLSAWDLSKAYPMVGIGFALTVAVGFAMGEHVSGTRIAGTALVAAGVFLIGRS